MTDHPLAAQAQHRVPPPHPDRTLRTEVSPP
jgi:hypothetical protein